MVNTLTCKGDKIKAIQKAIDHPNIPDADYELCTALLTMLLREDHFSNGSFMVRKKKGEVNAILTKMIEELSK